MLLQAIRNSIKRLRINHAPTGGFLEKLANDFGRDAGLARDRTR